MKFETRADTATTPDEVLGVIAAGDEATGVGATGVVTRRLDAKNARSPPRELVTVFVELAAPAPVVLVLVLVLVLEFVVPLPLKLTPPPRESALPEEFPSPSPLAAPPVAPPPVWPPAVGDDGWRFR